MKPGGQIGVMAVITLLLAACSGEPGADATTSSPDAAALTTSTVDTSAPDFIEAAGGFRHPAGPACDGLVDEYLDELQQQLSSYESVELADLAREIPDHPPGDKQPGSGRGMWQRHVLRGVGVAGE